MPTAEESPLPNSTATDLSTLGAEAPIDYVYLGVVPLAELGPAITNAQPAEDRCIGFDLSPEDDARFQAYLGAAKLAEERAALDRQLSDPNCPPDKVAELTDDLITVDMAMGPMRNAMGTKQKPDLTLIPGKPSSESLAAMIEKFTGKAPDPVEHAEAMKRIDAAFERALAAKKRPE